MTKTRTKKPTESQGADHDMTKTNAMNPARTDPPAAPRESLSVRALDQELDWYFSYAESARHRATLRILPTYAAIPLLATDATDGALSVRALELAATVSRALATLRGKHAEVLRAAYTPRSWPTNVETAFAGVAAIAVRLAFADDPWPARRARSGLEQAAAARLSAAIVGKSVPVGRLRSQAERLRAGAIAAYAEVRTPGPSATGSR